MFELGSIVWYFQNIEFNTTFRRPDLFPFSELAVIAPIKPEDESRTRIRNIGFDLTLMHLVNRENFITLRRREYCECYLAKLWVVQVRSLCQLSGYCGLWHRNMTAKCCQSYNELNDGGIIAESRTGCGGQRYSIKTNQCWNIIKFTSSRKWKLARDPPRESSIKSTEILNPFKLSFFLMIKIVIYFFKYSW